MKKYYSDNLNYKYRNFKKVKISLASPDLIRSWSYGEVTKPETINYRTFKPERKGLFCAQIFGPIVDGSCLCEKYQKPKHKGIVCEKCGVEVTSSRVRRERMGHINLHYPVIHPWFIKHGIISKLLGISNKKLEQILNFEYEVIYNAHELQDFKGSILLEDEVSKLKAIYQYGEQIKIGSGARVIKELLHNIDVDKERVNNLQNLIECASVNRSLVLAKRQRILEDLYKSNTNPAWMALEAIPVLPCDLRPLVQVQGGRFASSDLNELYKNILNRNNRLHRLLDLKAPEVILNNERRMLQESVENLFSDHIASYSSKKELKSIASKLKGKLGRFRHDLLGKRVDYSGRSVITAGPDLELNECGMPAEMLIELFKPFLYRDLYAQYNIATIAEAKVLIQQRDPIIYNILHNLTSNSYVLLNRAPTLHKCSILAFKPKITMGKSISLHPLVCSPFNADFDGDTMAVHLPISQQACQEADNLMQLDRNLMNNSNGEFIIKPSQDMVLGLYFSSLVNETQHQRLYISHAEVIRHYEQDIVKLHDCVRFKINNQIFNTTVGRILIHHKLQIDIPFNIINTIITKSVNQKIVSYCIENHGRAAAVKLLNNIKNIGLEFASKSGVSIGLSDLVAITQEKNILVKSGFDYVKELSSQYALGFINDKERHIKVLKAWADVNKELTDIIQAKVIDKPYADPIYMNALQLILISGSRGSMSQIKQILGMRGLMSKTDGQIIEHPIIYNFVEGIAPLEYFISTHGARKGLADKALSTADTGYLTRKLADVCQDIVISKHDCGTKEGIVMDTIIHGPVHLNLSQRVVGRCLLEDVKLQDQILPANSILTAEHAKQIEQQIGFVKIRSPITCGLNHNVCQLCYGYDLAQNDLVDLGEAVGIIASQCVGEPATQLTLRLFHTGGIYSADSDQAVSPIYSIQQGTVSFNNLNIITRSDNENINIATKGQIIISNQTAESKINIPYGAIVHIKPGDIIDQHTLIASSFNSNVVIAENSGTVSFEFDAQLVRSNPNNWYVALHSDPKQSPIIKILNNKKKVLAEYRVPSGYQFQVREYIQSGDVVYRNQLALVGSGQQQDILGGLQTLIDLVQMRRHTDRAILSDFDGKIIDINYNPQHIIITVQAHEDPDKQKSYILPNSLVTSNYQVNDEVAKGEPLTDLEVDLADLIDRIGVTATATELLRRINIAMLTYGVNINDKHYETIISKMVSKSLITSKNNSEFIFNELHDTYNIIEANKNLPQDDQILFKPCMISIVKASLNCSSFLSAASFQDTQKVLVKSCLAGSVDTLLGLKENLIVGNDVPCGTGFKK